MKAIWQGLISVRFGVPILFLILGCILMYSLHTNVRIDWTRNNHPATWPVIMIFCLMSVAGIILLWSILDEWRGHHNRTQMSRQPEAHTAPPEHHEGIMTDAEADLIASEGVIAGEHDNRKMIWGIAGVFAYGFAITYLGSAFATMAIIVYWLLICGDRNPIKLALTSLLGTAAILYIFQKMAYLPLPKGVGVFHDMTIWLYRMIKIF